MTDAWIVARDKMERDSGIDPHAGEAQAKEWAKGSQGDKALANMVFDAINHPDRE